ncbi:MAG: cob(I)yrinic acid a,c-diamide adenosyltransferase, partial [Candidatus Latescibacteria bacterium]|nr:cob(I)yrinic acid a,c-diamide adenosyltransferase [Candidatus Latescibacterota bacterium]
MSKQKAIKVLPPDQDGEQEHQLHLYYGFGKGKTTCCMGLVLRALGAGQRVALVQFDKGYDGENEHYAERKILRQLEGIDLVPTGCERMMPDGSFRFGAQPDDIAEAQRGLAEAQAFIQGGEHDLVVLDEILAAAAYDLLVQDDVMQTIFVWQKNRYCELAMSGHKVWDELVAQADLVT